MSWSSNSLVTLRTRTGEQLDGWLEKVRTSQISELQRFVASVERDKAAFVAGLTLPQNNGLVEGKVNNSSSSNAWDMRERNSLCCASAFSMLCNNT